MFKFQKLNYKIVKIEENESQENSQLNNIDKFF